MSKLPFFQTFLIFLQDPDASYDVNDGDPDPQPRYTQLNDNRYVYKTSRVLILMNETFSSGFWYGFSVLDKDKTPFASSFLCGLDCQYLFSCPWRHHTFFCLGLMLLA